MSRSAATGCRRCSPRSCPGRTARPFASACWARTWSRSATPTARSACWQSNCPHRGASLFFGRNEEDGLRCVYHGWKFDVAGDVRRHAQRAAGERTSSTRSRSSPTRASRRGGLIWAYMGPPDKQPPLPEFEWTRAPAEHRYVTKIYQECNYLQAMEGDFDTSHSSFLHRMFQTESANSAATFGSTGYRARSTAPRLVVLRTDFGFTYASIRNVKDEGKNFVRAYQWVMPFQQMRAYAGFANLPSVHGHMWVPIDDETCWVYNWMYHIDGSELPEEEVLYEEAFFGRGPGDLIPGTYKSIANKSNDYLIDREMQRTVNFTGINGVNAQDMAIQESRVRSTIGPRSTSGLPIWPSSLPAACSRKRRPTWRKAKILWARAMPVTASAPPRCSCPKT